jgi:hypothetical protein
LCVQEVTKKIWTSKIKLNFLLLFVYLSQEFGK